MKQPLTSRYGFTLLELLVTATLIAVLTVIGVVSFSSVNKRSRDVKRKSDIEQIRSALEMYRSDNGYYPAMTVVSMSGFESANNLASSLVSSTPSYIPSIPSDPNPSQDYWYAALSPSGGQYYGYCVCAMLETTLPATPNTCTGVTLPSGSTGCNYGLKNP